MVQVKDTFILADFVVLDMEGDLGISLILGRPFLGDEKARIDVGTGKISLRIMGKTMKFRFQNKKELFLIHENREGDVLWAEPGWEVSHPVLRRKPNANLYVCQNQVSYI